MKTRIHPLDFDALEKGTWIEADEIEDAIMRKRDDPSFHKRLLGLKAQIEQNTGIISRVEGCRLRLMTDEEALKWTERQSVAAFRKMKLQSERLRSRIDHAQLAPDSQVEHEHATRVVTAMHDAQTRAIRRHSRLSSLFKKAPLPPESTGDDDDDD